MSGSWLRRTVRAGVTTAAGFVLVMAVSLQFDMSQGWVTALKGTGKVKSTFSLATMSGMLTTEALHWFRFAVDEDTMIELFRTGGLVAAAALAWAVLAHSSRFGTELAVGITLFFTVMLGPVLWPWYMPPAIALIAVQGVERVRPALTVWCIALTLFVFPTSVSTGGGSGGAMPIYGMLLLLGLTALSLLAQWVFGQPVLPPSLRARWHRLRAVRRAGGREQPHAVVAS